MRPHERSRTLSPSSTLHPASGISSAKAEGAQDCALARDLSSSDRRPGDAGHLLNCARRHDLDWEFSQQGGRIGGTVGRPVHRQIPGPGRTCTPLRAALGSYMKQRRARLPLLEVLAVALTASATRRRVVLDYACAGSSTLVSEKKNGSQPSPPLHQDHAQLGKALEPRAGGESRTGSARRARPPASR